MRQVDRSLQETSTTLAPESVLEAAKSFFARRNSIYAAYLDKEGPSHVTFRGQGGEEVIIAARALDSGGTAVTGSTYMFDQQVARFFATLPPSPAATPPAPGEAARRSDGGA